MLGKLVDPLRVLRAGLNIVVRDTEVSALSVRQLQVLLLAAHEPRSLCTVGNLAASMQMPKSAVCRAMDKMEELRLVGREYDPMDKRQVFAVATIEGTAFLNRLERAMLPASWR